MALVHTLPRAARWALRLNDGPAKPNDAAMKATSVPLPEPLDGNRVKPLAMCDL